MKRGLCIALAAAGGCRGRSAPAPDVSVAPAAASVEVVAEGDADGAAWDASIEDAFGESGLDLADAAGLATTSHAAPTGVSATMTIGHGAGVGGPGGWGGARLGGHRVFAPRIRQGMTSVSGRLPPEVIQRIVRTKFDAFLGCYKPAAKANHELQGRVTVKFVIDRDGAISVATDGGSDLPDQNVVQCVVRSMSGLHFPQPEGGIVTVVYPMIFSPGDQ